MIAALLILWLIAIVIQLTFILFIFSRTAFHRGSARSNNDIPDVSPTPAKQPGVTIVVCAWNELHNLTELLPLLNDQHYHNFEVLVMDDRSTDGSQQFLENEISHLPRVRSIRIDKDYDHVTPKKYALTIALKKALHPVVLLTDADCRPAGPNWLSHMIAHLDKPALDIVLGFSPYEHRPGFLNLLIRIETLFTAVQYFSLALAGRPYMGVGRNLMYRRQLFFDNRGFYSHKHVLGGDDDLFMNEVATGSNTAISLDPATFTWSKPKETWAAWRHQKRRHLNVGKHYKQGHKIRLGLLTGSHLLTWWLGLIVSLVVGIAWQYGRAFTDVEQLLLGTVAGLFALRLLTFWGIVGRISYRLAHTVHWAVVPVIDAVLAVYFVVMGFNTYLNRHQKTYWR